VSYHITAMLSDNTLAGERPGVPWLPAKALQQGDNSMEFFWLFKMAAALSIQHF
jgi:hypothetical protein